MWLTMALYLFVGSFFGWALWVLSPRHPGRLKRLRAQWGVVEEEDLPPPRHGPFR